MAKMFDILIDIFVNCNCLDTWWQ